MGFATWPAPTAAGRHLCPRELSGSIEIGSGKAMHLEYCLAILVLGWFNLWAFMAGDHRKSSAPLGSILSSRPKKGGILDQLPKWFLLLGLGGLWEPPFGLCM